MTKERPILFTGDMVRALLDSSKTQTRRALKVQPWSVSPVESGRHIFDFRADKADLEKVIDLPTLIQRCPYGQPGDRLWVRETHAPRADCGCAWDRSKAEAFNRMQPGELCYAADLKDTDWVTKWRPGIHMFRWASRITLEIVSVRVERLQDISPDDAYAEGAAEWAANNPPLDHEGEPDKFRNIVLAYRALWETINGPGSWALNPWVWVIEFKKVKP